MAPIINQLAKYVPPRRKRRLHVGLFGYTRGVGKVTLPRAIVFCAALYSIGLPPELIAYSCLNSQELKFLSEIYPNLESDLASSLTFYNPKVKEILPGEVINELALPKIPFKANKEHLKITSRIIEKLKEGSPEVIEDSIVEAAWQRKFLG